MPSPNGMPVMCSVLEGAINSVKESLQHALNGNSATASVRTVNAGGTYFVNGIHAFDWTGNGVGSLYGENYGYNDNVGLYDTNTFIPIPPWSNNIGFDNSGGKTGSWAQNNTPYKVEQSNWNLYSKRTDTFDWTGVISYDRDQDDNFYVNNSTVDGTESYVATNEVIDNVPYVSGYPTQFNPISGSTDYQIGKGFKYFCSNWASNPNNATPFYQSCLTNTKMEFGNYINYFSLASWTEWKIKYELSGQINLGNFYTRLRDDMLNQPNFTSSYGIGYATYVCTENQNITAMPTNTSSFDGRKITYPSANANINLLNGVHAVNGWRIWGNSTQAQRFIEYQRSFAELTGTSATEGHGYWIGRCRAGGLYLVTNNLRSRIIEVVSTGIISGSQRVGYGLDLDIPEPPDAPFPLKTIQSSDYLSGGGYTISGDGAITADYYFAVVGKDPQKWAADNGYYFGFHEYW